MLPKARNPFKPAVGGWQRPVALPQTPPWGFAPWTPTKGEPLESIHWVGVREGKAPGLPSPDCPAASSWIDVGARSLGVTTLRRLIADQLRPWHWR